VFLGENADEVSQIYASTSRTGTLVQLTHHPSAILDYDVRYDGRRIVFVAQPVRQTGSCKERHASKASHHKSNSHDLLRDLVALLSQYAYAGQLSCRTSKIPGACSVQEPIRHEFRFRYHQMADTF